MVNTGKPSTGCHTCRKRKVKCDEQKPACKRCVAIGQHCPGYRETNVTFFRNQSSWAKEKVWKRLASAPGSSSLSPPSSLSDFGSTSPSASPQAAHTLAAFVSEFDGVALRDRSPAVPRSPYVDPAVFAVSRFYTEYVVSKGLMPFLDFLPDLYQKSNLDPCFQQALPAVAMASAARQLRTRGLMAKAQSRYGQALSALAVAIKDPARAKSDEIFTAVFLLGMYEIITSEKVTSGVWDTHYRGRLALMNIRGKDQLKSSIGRSMFMIMHNQLFINSFVGREPPADEWLDWFFPLMSPNGGDSSILEYGKVAYQVAHCHANLAKATGEFKKSDKVDSNKLIALIIDCIKIDETLKETIVRLPSDLPVEKSPWPSSWATKNLNPEGPVHEVIADACQYDERCFYTRWTAILAWNQFRTVRIHLFQVLHEAADVIEETADLDLPHLRCQWEKESAEMVEDFCATLPYMLGGLNPAMYQQPEIQWGPGASLRGYMLLWPLRAAILAIGISPERRKWIAGVLNCIGVTLGIGQALGLAQLALHKAPREAKSPRNSAHLLQSELNWAETTTIG